MLTVEEAFPHLVGGKFFALHVEFPIVHVHIRQNY